MANPQRARKGRSGNDKEGPKAKKTTRSSAAEKTVTKASDRTVANGSRTSFGSTLSNFPEAAGKPKSTKDDNAEVEEIDDESSLSESSDDEKTDAPRKQSGRTESLDDCASKVSHDVSNVPVPAERRNNTHAARRPEVGYDVLIDKNKPEAEKAYHQSMVAANHRMSHKDVLALTITKTKELVFPSIKFFDASGKKDAQTEKFINNFMRKELPEIKSKEFKRKIVSEIARTLRVRRSSVVHSAGIRMRGTFDDCSTIYFLEFLCSF